MEKASAFLEEIIRQLGLPKNSDFSQVDSLSLMALVLELEQRFDIEIQFQEINKLNFQSFAQLELFVLDKIKKYDSRNK